MGCWGGLSVNCGERHNHLLCQYAGTNTEAWTVCTTPEMDLMGVRNQGLLALCQPGRLQGFTFLQVNGGGKSELGGFGYRKWMTMIRPATPLSETKSTRGVNPLANPVPVQLEGTVWPVVSDHSLAKHSTGQMHPVR
uniref:Uncharacterized protein n=1 Tax=Oryza glaberrima TaxID=4538 RepID=I1Q3G7_ORYGL